MWATVALEKSKAGTFSISDHESCELHDTEAEGRAAVKDGLRSGDKFVALFKLDGVYDIAEMSLSRVDE